MQLRPPKLQICIMPNKPLPPVVNEALAKKFVLEHYGFLPTSIKKLNSYIDLNFLIQNEKQEKFVLKISHKDAEVHVLEGQHQMLNKLQEIKKFDACFPKIIPALSQKEILFLKDEKNERCATRLLTFLEGDLYAEVPHTSELIAEFGTFLGSINKQLSHLPSTALQVIDSPWDLKNAHYNLDLISAVSNPADRRLVDYFLLQFEETFLPELRHLRKAVIHGDANDYNLLVRNNKIAGIIDFGDACFTPVICESAIALAYIMMGKDDPVQIATWFIRNYNEQFPLEEKEIKLLYYLIAARLCTSVIMSAYSRKLDPTNAYISVSEKPGWALLHKLLGINPAYFEQKIREVCGFEGRKFKDYSKEISLREKHLAPSFSLSYTPSPLKIFKGGLQYLYDENGRTYLDGVNNICHVGHCHPKVVRASQRQMARLNTNTRYLYDSLNEYTSQLASKFPDPLNRVFLVNSGSEATELALRLARTHTKRTDVVVVDGAYHGNSGAGVAISPYKFEGKGGFDKLGWVHKVPAPDIYRGPFKKGTPNVGTRYANEVTKVLAEAEKSDKKIAAYFCESLLSCGGQILLPPSYLKRVYQAIRAHGGVCVADEVQVGFGRVGAQFWGFELQEVVPDIVVFGKPIGNGHPMAGVITTNEIANSFNNGMEFFSSFGGNPVSCEVGKAVLKVIEEENLQQHAFEIGNYMLEGFRALKAKFPLIGDVRGAGLFLGIELVRDRITLEPAAREASQLVTQMKEKGILLSTDGPLHNVIKFKPPMVFSRLDADRLLGALADCLLVTGSE